jgi:Exopolyphosphatase-related proteins
LHLQTRFEVKQESKIPALDKIIRECRKAVVVAHFNPDGDAVGSIVGLYHYLKGRGIDVTAMLPSLYPDFLAFLNPSEKGIVIFKDEQEKALEILAGADTIFCLDFNRMSRTEFMADALTGSKAAKVLIDHHIAPETDNFDLVISTIETSSTCELLFWTLMELPDVNGDAGNLTMECVNALYTGMMTDTNNFSNSVLPSTFRMGAALLERGVDKTALQYNVLNVYSEDRMRLMGHLLKDKMVVLDKYDASYMLLSNKEKDAHNFKIGDSEGFVNLPLSIGKVTMSALFTENFDGAYIRVSLRSKGDVDVNTLSNRYFNGGGHKNAAGGRLYMPLEEVPAYFEKSLKEYFEK